MQLDIQQSKLRDDKSQKAKGMTKVNFLIDNGKELSIGDILLFGMDKDGKIIEHVVIQIVERRQSKGNRKCSPFDIPDLIIAEVKP